jgi:hypothetical protein
MFLSPALGRLLAQAKLEEAQSRMPRAHVLRAAALERQAEAVTVPSAKSDEGRESPVPARKRRWLRRPRQDSNLRPTA